MKAAFPVSKQLLAVAVATAGAVVVLLFSWAMLASWGLDPSARATWTPSADSMAFTPMPVARLTGGSGPLPGAHRPYFIERSAEERLATSADLLDFVEGIRRRPLPGGHYLALKAYDFCTREARLTLDAMNDGNSDAAAVIDGRQFDAQARLARLCGSFRYRDVAALDYYQLVEEGLQAGDSRLILGRRLERLSAQWDTVNRDDGPARQSLIADVLTRGDGALIRDLAGEFEVILQTGQLLISGQPVDTAESADVIDALWMMACDTGVSCSREGEWQQLLACASAGECTAPPLAAGANSLRWRNRIREALLTSPAAIDVVPMIEQRF